VPRKLLAFALGNPHRGDDGAGLAVAEGLAALVEGLEVVEVQELLPEHAEQVAGAAWVVFIDASISGLPGTVSAHPVSARAARAAVTHALTPEEVVGLAGALHGRAPPAALVTISGRDFAFGERLSPEVQAAVPAARERVRALAREAVGG
jgi:hydrogenase maturation protease